MSGKRLDKPVVFFRHGVARPTQDEDDIPELEERGYQRVPDRDLPQGVPVDQVGKPFDRTKPETEQEKGRGERDAVVQESVVAPAPPAVL